MRTLRTQRTCAPRTAPCAPCAPCAPISLELPRVHALFDLGTLVVTLILLTTVGLDLRPADFARVRAQPGMVAAGVLVPPLVLPSVAVGLIAWLEPPAARVGPASPRLLSGRRDSTRTAILPGRRSRCR